jgi:hypothetical protein
VRDAIMLSNSEIMPPPCPSLPTGANSLKRTSTRARAHRNSVPFTAQSCQQNIIDSQSNNRPEYGILFIRRSKKCH